MPNKQYKTKKNNTLNVVSEPAVAYSTKAITNSWNPNVPFCGTQEEWWEHFHRIEEGEFCTAEEAEKEFELWKIGYLASRI